MGTDPFAHGTPVGDSHTWVDPGRLPCPDCPCCTVNLCRTAHERGRTCAAIGDSGPGVMDLRGCPCNAARLPAAGVRWTAVVAVLGEDAGGGRWLSANHPWTLRSAPVPLRTIGPSGDVVGEVWKLEIRDGLLHASGVLTDRQYAADMFGDDGRPATLFPAIEAQADVVAPVLHEAADVMVAELRGGTVTAIALTTDPSWPGRVEFREATDG